MSLTVDAYINRGVIYARQRGQLDAAIIDFSEAISLKPDVPAFIYLNRALAYSLVEAPGTILEDLRQALKDPALKPNALVCEEFRWARENIQEVRELMGMD